MPITILDQTLYGKKKKKNNTIFTIFTKFDEHRVFTFISYLHLSILYFVLNKKPPKSSTT